MDPARPAFYDALPEGGVWKTENAGMTWFPIFDAIKTVSSVGAIAVAPGDPNIIYAGTGDLVGEGAIDEGDGVYKSTDAGKTWVHLGLEATKQIPALDRGSQKSQHCTAGGPRRRSSP